MHWSRRALLRMAAGGAASIAVSPGLMRPASAEGSATATEVRSFNDLDGWSTHDPRAALAYWRVVDRADASDLPAAAAFAAMEPGDARAWIEARFEPHQLGAPKDGHFTGYYEPVIVASEVRTDRFTIPLHGMPGGPEPVGGWPDRAAIERGALAGKAPTLFWLSDPVELFFLQVQGSGRLKLGDGRLVRIGYAGRNAHAYTSVGRILVAEGHLPRQGVTAEAVQDWLRADPDRGRAMMHRNRSYVFFRVIDTLAIEDGPIGAAGVPLRAGVSIAIDPAFHPLGSLIWAEVRRRPPGLMVAADTGSAIKGAQRGDLFFGTGAEAGRIAGAVNQGGAMLRLVPRRVQP